MSVTVSATMRRLGTLANKASYQKLFRLSEAGEVVPPPGLAGAEGTRSGLLLRNEKRYLDGSLSFSNRPGPSLHTATDAGPQECRSSRGLYLPSNLSLHYEEPLLVKSGKGAHIFDEKGNRYVDCVNNVAHVGHSNSAVNTAIKKQLDSINTNTRYLHPTIARYAEKLCSTLSEKMGTNSVVFFCNSGSEANDLAINISKRVTGHQGVISLDGAYHGHVLSLVDISNYSKYNRGEGFAPPANVKVVPVPEMSGIKAKDARRDLGTEYARMVADAADGFVAEGQGTAAFITEILQSCGGQIVMPKGYLKQAFEATRARGGLVIADEVQTGFGRSGKRFWMHQLHKGALPDMITFGKPAGNGYPLAGVIVAREIADEFAKHNAGYFNTFGGNTVAVAAGEAVFDFLTETGLQEDAARLGKRLKRGLKGCGSPLVTDVRGSGLMLGVELTRLDGLPGAAEADFVMNRMKDYGVLVSTDGPDRNVIKFKPPMVISEEDIDRVAFAMDQALMECLDQSGRGTPEVAEVAEEVAVEVAKEVEKVAEVAQEVAEMTAKPGQAVGWRLPAGQSAMVG